MVPFLLFVCPFLCQLLAYITSTEATRTGAQTAGLTGLFGWAASCSTHVQECLQSILAIGFSVRPTLLAFQFVAGFAGLALVSSLFFVVFRFVPFCFLCFGLL